VPHFARSGDFWSGLALAALGAYVVVSARGWDYMGEEGPGPGFFPLWYGSAMVVLSLLLVMGSILKRRTSAAAGLRRSELGRAMLCWVAFVACIVLMRFVGFVPAFALLAWFIVAVMARQPQRVALPVAIGGALGFYALFTWALDVSLPPGILF
jgi:putative tricarboxylic transport membrane protein